MLFNGPKDYCNKNKTYAYNAYSVKETFSIYDDNFKRAAIGSLKQ